MMCPWCHRRFSDSTYGFCPDDGARLLGAPVARQKPKQTRQFGAILEDRYVIQDFIGAGGMARVYAAEDTHTKGQVAVKILNRNYTGDLSTRERFLREVEVAAEIGHPNVVQVLDAGERKDGTPFIVLELLVGESLGTLLRREGVMSKVVALPLIQQTASALAAAHAAGIIHRDVKPDNLFLVTAPDGRLAVKVMDFGMAKLKTGPTTGAGIVLGTVPYMAPEQALADPVDARTDIYGLGITICRMLTGHMPFSSPDDALVVAQHAFVEAPRLNTLRPGLDPRIEALVATALRKIPGNRYRSMRALLEDVERIVDERSGELVGAPLVKTPDIYEPQRPMSQQAARFLRGLLS